MYKQRIKLGLLLSALFLGSLYGMQPALENLKDSLDDLRRELGGIQQPHIQLPPPVLQGGPITPIITGPLPPPPVVQAGAISTPSTKTGAPVSKSGRKPGLGDVTNIGFTPIAGSDKPKQPVASGIGLSAEQLEQQRKEREARLAVAKQKKAAAGDITKGFITAAFATYPVSATVPAPIATKDFGVEREAVNAINIKSDTILNQLKSNLFTQDDKRERQPLAKKLLNGLLFFTRNNVVQPDQIKQIADLVVLILNIDPLLITTADAVLRQLGFDDVAIHRLMTLFFEERIRFIQETLEELKKQATEGAIQDIDQAFAYSIALSSELIRQESIVLDEHTTAAQKQEAQWFIDKVRELRKRLCEIITAPDNIVLFNTKPALKELYLTICGAQQKAKLRVYCVTAAYTYGKTLEGKRKGRDYTYCGFDQEIQKIMDEIKKFNALEESEMSVSQRVYTVQTIISSLADINTFFTNPDVCPNCLREAIRFGHPKVLTVSQVEEPFKMQLAQIADFLLAMNKRDNSFYLENFVRTGIPNIKTTLDRVRKLSDKESAMIYGLIGINRVAKEKNLGPYNLDDFLHGRIPQWLIQEKERRRMQALSV
ncbi:MAG: hypothetical protein AB7F19_07145 [Candidatus Babeliales bacterium]